MEIRPDLGTADGSCRSLHAYIIVRQKFAGRNLFEFALMMSFAIPGTVIGRQLHHGLQPATAGMTGSALILVACFVSATCRLVCAAHRGHEPAGQEPG